MVIMIQPNIIKMVESVTEKITFNSMHRANQVIKNQLK